MAAASRRVGTSVGHPVPRELSIAMTPPGHWHFTRTKQLVFAVTDAAGVPVDGLIPEITIRTLSGRVDRLVASDLGGGTYATEYTAWDIGPDYATSYAVLCTIRGHGERYSDAWTIEVVRDGREDIFKGDGQYAYQVRYGWSPGRPLASVDAAVVFYLEPRRAIPEGEALDRRQPWRHPTDHLPGLAATLLIRSSDGLVGQELAVEYVGLGVYRAERIFPPGEVGAGRTYNVSLLFTDPHNGQTIGVDDNSYVLEVGG